MKLYQLSLNNERLYVIGRTTQEEEIRFFHVYTDHGDMPQDEFENIAKNGKLTEITSLAEVPREDWNIIPNPLDTGIREDEDFEETISSFFSLKS